MSTAALESEAERLTVVDRLADAVRGAAHMSHEARLLRSVAADAVEDATRATRRALTRGLEGVHDLRDDVVHRVKRQPLQAVAAAMAVGALLGLTTGWIVRGFLHCKKP